MELGSSCGLVSLNDDSKCFIVLGILKGEKNSVRN